MKFSYSIAASYLAEGKQSNPATNVFNFDPNAQIINQKTDKRARPDSGQDAFFVSRIGKSGDVAFGVADGVSGWMDYGFDSADFSHGLCNYMAYTASTYPPNDGSPVLSARGIIEKGYEAIVKDETNMAGGTTVCVGIAKEDGSLEVANLGDSGFVQLRSNTIHNYSQDQMLMLGVPYQLTIIPPNMKNAYIHNFPKDASVTKHSLRHGDVLVFATDGVWDNLSKKNVLQIVNKLMVDEKAWEPTQQGIRVGERLTMSTTPQAENQSISLLQSSLAIGIASEAKAMSASRKLDDICVVVAIVLEEGK